MIIFESIFITFIFKSSIIKGSWNSSVNWLKPKIKPPKANLACPNA